MDFIQLILIGLAVVIPLIAQSRINSAYNKYSKIASSKRLSGKEVARKILDSNGLQNIGISEISGNLTDHYDPSHKHVNLSTAIYNEESIASISVAAHECGHAIQDKESYSMLRFRSTLVPIVNFTSRFATIFLMIGLMAQLTSLFTIGIILLSGGLLFQLVTLPVEFNASARAKVQLEKLGIVDKKDQEGVNIVLRAAALTYVASFLSTALQIVRLVLINRDRRY